MMRSFLVNFHMRHAKRLIIASFVLFLATAQASDSLPALENDVDEISLTQGEYTMNLFQPLMDLAYAYLEQG